MKALSRSSFIVASCATLMASACVREPSPAVSAPTLTSSYVATASPLAAAGPAAKDAAGMQIPGPNDPTSYRIPTFIADASRATAAVATTPPISVWSKRYPDAARSLAEWSESHGAAAEGLGRWTERHPDQMPILVAWAVTNVEDPLGAFFLNRSTFGDLQRIADEDRAAVDELLHWIRSAPMAAEELAAHPGGLAFTTLHEKQLARAHSSLGAETSP